MGIKLIVRGADMGYTRAFDEGALRSMTEGIVTSADVMMDTLDSDWILDKLRDMPWISVGWHMHLWGRPVADPALVPSMINEEGKFKFRHDRSLMDTVEYEEALIELRAQVEKCVRILGRAPDMTTARGEGPIDRAKIQVCQEYNIKINTTYGAGRRKPYITEPDEEWKSLNIYEVPIHDREDLSFEMAKFKDYNPVAVMKSIDLTKTDRIWLRGGHPGYLDDYILSESTCHVHRVADLKAMVSQELKDWIIDNKIELINHRDALYGTCEYQNHLKAIGSPLAVR